MYTIKFTENAQKQLVILAKKAPAAMKKLAKLLEELRVHPTKTAAFREAMDDKKHGRIYHAESVDDMFSQILG